MGSSFADLLLTGKGTTDGTFPFSHFQFSRNDNSSPGIPT